LPLDGSTSNEKVEVTGRSDSNVGTFFSEKERQPFLGLNLTLALNPLGPRWLRLIQGAYQRIPFILENIHQAGNLTEYFIYASICS
jgi:hypothetical protein